MRQSHAWEDRMPRLRCGFRRRDSLSVEACLGAGCSHTTLPKASNTTWDLVALCFWSGWVCLPQNLLRLSAAGRGVLASCPGGAPQRWGSACRKPENPQSACLSDRLLEAGCLL